MLHSQGHQGEITRERALAALKTHGGDRRSEAFQAQQEKQVEQGNNVTLKARGNQAAYLKARLARDAPEVLERVKAGEFKSARAAAIIATATGRD